MSKRNFVKLVYLISRFFLAWTFLNFLAHSDSNNNEFKSSNDEDDDEIFDEKPKNRIKFVNPMISYATVLKL